MKAKISAALKIWIVIYPSITALLFFFGKPLSVMPLYLRTLLLTGFLVPWMMFVCIPILNYLINRVSKASDNEKSSGV